MKRLWTEQMTIEVFNLFCQEPSVSWNEEVPSSVSTYNYRDALNLSLNSGKSLWKYNVAIRLSFATFDGMILLARGLSAFISQKSNTKKANEPENFFIYIAMETSMHIFCAESYMEISLNLDMRCAWRYIEQSSPPGR